MDTRASNGRSPFLFVLLVFGLSIPLWLAGGITGLQVVPGVPASAVVVAFCPMIAALILIYAREKGAGVAGLLKKSFDFVQTRPGLWYIPTLLLMPAVMLLEYVLLRMTGSPVPAPRFPIWSPLIMFVVYYIAALGEELGWMGYTADPLQHRLNALGAALLLGAVWAVWHFVPLVQVGRSPQWIAWWSLTTVAQRVVIFWLYNNTRRSVSIAAAFHAMINVSWQLFPVSGSFYDPRITGLIVTAVALVVVIAWGPRTLASRR